LLQDQGHECLGVDQLAAPTTHHVCDLKDRSALEPLLDGIDVVIHTASLHGRHVDLGVARRDFVDTNIVGTLTLLELARAAGVGKFIYTSTTSIYGHALENDKHAVWVDESLETRPRDIYDITKQAAEELCREFFDAQSLQTCVLRVSRFMDEPANSIANYRLYRGLDERDGAQAHLLAAEYQHANFEIFNISNQSPFAKQDLVELKVDPAAVIQRYFPESVDLYATLDWAFPHSIDRVYVTEKAERLLAYRPQHNFLEYVRSMLAGD
jgi:nucleoside-diphosphate-sugar epimerase